MTLHQATLRANIPMHWQPQILRITKDTLHPIVITELGIAVRAFHLTDLGFKDTGTEWAFDETFRLGSGGHQSVRMSPNQRSNRS